eukprot:1195928-Prorocentrum_minimum.AAC.1
MKSRSISSRVCRGVVLGASLHRSESGCLGTTGGCRGAHKRGGEGSEAFSDDALGHVGISAYYYTRAGGEERISYAGMAREHARAGPQNMGSPCHKTSHQAGPEGHRLNSV